MHRLCFRNISFVVWVQAQVTARCNAARASEKIILQINTEVVLLFWLQAVVKYKILCHESVEMLSWLFIGLQQRKTPAKIKLMLFGREREGEGEREGERETERLGELINEGGEHLCVIDPFFLVIRSIPSQ